MSGIEMIKVRAKVTISTIPSIETPYVVSFNVNKKRNTPSTFSARLKIHYEIIQSNLVSSSIMIEAGEKDRLKVIFVGMIKQTKISPCNEDPSFVLLDLSGSDYLDLLVGRKFSRRCRGTKTSWVTIDSSVRSGLRSSKFKYRKDYLKPVNTELGEDPEAVSTRGLYDKNLSAIGLASSTDRKPESAIIKVESVSVSD